MNSAYGVSISCTHFTGEQVVVWLQRPSSDWLAGVPKGRRGGVEARWQGLQGPTQVAIRFGKFNQTGNVWPDLSDNICPLFLSNRLLKLDYMSRSITLFLKGSRSISLYHREAELLAARYIWNVRSCHCWQVATVWLEPNHTEPRCKLNVTW